jgi:hypothetical protein
MGWPTIRATSFPTMALPALEEEVIKKIAKFVAGETLNKRG